MLVDVNYERRLWERLIESLDGWTCATEIAPGTIEVALPANETESRRVHIVMSPQEWTDMASVAWGDVDDAVHDVKQTLLRLQPHEGFAVYSLYQLEPCIAPTLPEQAPPPREATTNDGEWRPASGAGS